MTRVWTILSAVCFSLMLSTYAVPASAAEDFVSPAISDPGRPDEDRARDELRRPGPVVEFSTMQRGWKVMDIWPGGGYYTRILSKVVGPSGHVYAMVPASSVERRAEAADPVNAIAADAAYSNTTVVVAPLTNITADEPLDLVWTSLNYHDFKNMEDGVTAAMNESIFALLKPGGIYYVIDHAAEAGSGGRDTSTLHRIDPELVKTEVQAAGFVLAGESNTLRNRQDDHTTGVFSGDMRGNTDRFIMRFRKPRQ